MKRFTDQLVDELLGLWRFVPLTDKHVEDLELGLVSDSGQVEALKTILTLLSDRDVDALAASLGLHPGISPDHNVAGRLHDYGLLHDRDGRTARRWAHRGAEKVAAYLRLDKRAVIGHVDITYTSGTWSLNIEPPMIQSPESVRYDDWVEPTVGNFRIRWNDETWNIDYLGLREPFYLTDLDFTQLDAYVTLDWTGQLDMTLQVIGTPAGAITGFSTTPWGIAVDLYVPK